MKSLEDNGKKNGSWPDSYPVKSFPVGEGEPASLVMAQASTARNSFPGAASKWHRKCVGSCHR